MSLTAACGWTLCRSLIVALVAMPVAWELRSRLDSLATRPRQLLWLVLLVPFFTPTLLTGYAYSKWSLTLIRYPAWNEALYAALLALRLIPVGTLILQFCPPPPLSAEALHCARLQASRKSGKLARMRFLIPFFIRGPWRDALPVFTVVFLLAFQEFETASLMGTASWTVWLFDAQAGGAILGETLQRAALPGACELAVIATFLAYAIRSRTLPATQSRRPGVLSIRRDGAAWLLALTACGGVTVVPAVLLGRDALQGLSGVLRSQTMIGEIATAAGFGLSSGLLATLLASVIRRMATQSTSTLLRRSAAAVGIAAALPGLLGALVVSLIVLKLFQMWPLSLLYDTPVPAIVALILFLLPRAVLLQLLLMNLTQPQAIHTAALLTTSPAPVQGRAGAELIWQLRSRPQFLAAGLICIWGYLELTPVAILAPPGLTSAPVRLYNLMHYGRSFVVSAMTLVAMAVPPALLLLAGGLRSVLLARGLLNHGWLRRGWLWRRRHG